MTTPVFALSLLFLDVQAGLAADLVTANVVFGKREPAKQTNQGPGRANRVIFSPGVDGKLGSYDTAKRQGRPRPLLTLLEQATIYVWAFDSSAPNDERVQYEAARNLHDQVVRQIYKSPNVGHGVFKLTDPRIVDDKVERRFGCEFRFTLEIEARIPDETGVADPTSEVAVKPTIAVGPAEIATDTTADPIVYETDGTDTTVGT